MQMKPNYEEKNAITVIMSANQTITTTSATKLNLDTIRSKVGDKLTLQNNSVVIGKGIHHVLVSAQMVVSAHTTDKMRRLAIYKNSAQYVRTMNYVINNWESTACAPVLMEVEEGDTISLYSANEGDSTTITSSPIDTYLTVQAVA